MEGCPSGVIVVTDHQPLTHYMDQPVLSRVQTRWLRLGLFQSIRPTVKYQPGKANIVADALSQSQRPAAEESEEATAEEEVLQLTSSLVERQAEDLQMWKRAYQEDPKLKTVLSKLRQGLSCGGQYLTPAGLLAVKQGDLQKLVVPRSLRQQIMRENHNVPSVGHVGMRRTLELVDRHFHWRGLRGDVLQYVKTCPTCQVVKSNNRAKASLLRPLEIPSRKWAHITMNLVTDLPESNGYTAIAVFMDKLTKMVHLASCTKKVTAMEYAKLFVDHVFRLHDLPEVIISDRDPRFTGKFWKLLFDLLGTDLRSSIAFHPQTGGQSERMI